MPNQAENSIPTAFKGSLIVLMLVFWVPFIFMQTIYPFYRFGMFAEPRRSSVQMERFEILYRSGELADWQVFYAPKVGINADNFEYLKRNYFYRGEIATLLGQIREMQGAHVSTWCFVRTVSGDTTHRICERYKD